MPQQLTLYSIDGHDFAPGEEPHADETFHGYPVLGKAEITDMAERKAIMAALKQGITQSDGSVDVCFRPRYAILSTQNERVVAYVISFECLQMQMIFETEGANTIPIAPNRRNSSTRFSLGTAFHSAPE